MLADRTCTYDDNTANQIHKSVHISNGDVDLTLVLPGHFSVMSPEQF
jgi:hypothetical protein